MLGLLISERCTAELSSVCFLLNIMAADSVASINNGRIRNEGNSGIIEVT
jgi:hypothetical protein